MWHFNILDLLPYGRQEVWEELPRGLAADRDVRLVAVARRVPDQQQLT